MDADEDELAPLLQGDKGPCIGTETGLPSTDGALDHLDERVRDSLTLNRSPFGDYSYTCWPNDGVSPFNVPLEISGIPVVIPVDNTGVPGVDEGLRCPPDPRSSSINPGVCLPDELAWEILDLYHSAFGFYVLIDGQLQILVPRDFNIARAFRKKPRRFGGLRVSYAYASFSSPLGWAAHFVPSSQAMYNYKERFHDRDKEVTLDHRIQCGPFHRPRHYAIGRFGVRTECNGAHYLTGPTHMYYKPFRAAVKADYDCGEAYIVDTGQDLDMDGARTKHCFDPQPERWPLGSAHDVSLHHVRRPTDYPLARAPLPTTWLSESESRALKYHTARVATFSALKAESKAREAKLPPRRQCQIVGQAFFCSPVEEKHTRSATARAFVSSVVGTKPRKDQGCKLHPSLLFRLATEQARYTEGRAVCVMGEREDGSAHAKVAGFISYGQTMREPARWSSQGDWIGFFGAFPPPKKLIDEHVIL